MWNGSFVLESGCFATDCFQLCTFLKKAAFCSSPLKKRKKIKMSVYEESIEGAQPSARGNQRRADSQPSTPNKRKNRSADPSPSSSAGGHKGAATSPLRNKLSGPITQSPKKQRQSQRGSSRQGQVFKPAPIKPPEGPHYQPPSVSSGLTLSTSALPGGNGKVVQTKSYQV